ncbi:MAG: hypothetical protein AB7G80_03080 [Dongiaceae bacterium]
MPSLIRLNQILLILSALVVAALAALPVWVMLSVHGQSSLTLPPFTAPPVSPVMEEPVRNIFALDGQFWGEGVKKPAQAAAASPANPGAIQGLIQIPGLKGVIAGDRFVPIGGSAMGGEIQAVGKGQVMIQKPSGAESLKLTQPAPSTQGIEIRTTPKAD